MRIKGWGQGVNKDQPPWELAPGVWSDCLNVRFRSGKAQRVGGIASVLTPSAQPYFILPYSSGSTRYVFYAGTAKAFVHDGTTETEITRETSPAIQSITACARNSGVVTIGTGANHNLSTGDIVSVYGFHGANDSKFNKANATITVTNATHFTYTITDTSTASASNLSGAYSLVHYASGITVDFTGSVDDKWTGGNYNGVIYVNNPVDGLFYYDQSVTGVLHTFPDTYITTADAARSFKNFIFMLAPTLSGTKYLHKVAWSQSADPGSVPLSFTPAATNDAGDIDLVSDGEMVDALEWGDSLYIYKRDCRYSARYIGGEFIFDFQLVSGNHKDDGLMAANCVVNTPKGQVFLTDGGDVRIHAGGESKSLAIGRIREHIRSSIYAAHRKRSFLTVNPVYTEVCVCICTSALGYPDYCLTWNWEDDTWGIRNMTGVSCGAAGDYPTTISNDACLLVGYAGIPGDVGLVDSGSTIFGGTMTSMLERIGMDFDDPNYKSISKSLWSFDGSTNFTASIYHGSQKTQDGPVTYSSAVTYTHNTSRWLNAFTASAPYCAIKMTTTADDTPSLISIDLDVKSSGMY